MVSITVSIPEEIKKKMEQFPEINWSGLVKMIIEKKVQELILKVEMKKRFQDDRDFIDWSVITGKKVKKDIAQRLKKKGLIK